MLPKIPYRMEKNKSQSIPMRSINLGPAAEVGELSDSLGISTRKFPYLSVRQGDLKLDEYEGVKAMTVFGGELVTVREDGIYIGDELVTQIGSEEDNVIPGEKHFAPINSKLVIFPDKVYYDGQDKALHELGTSFTASSNENRFGANYFRASSRKTADSGYGGRFISQNNCFAAQYNKRKTLSYIDWYFVSEDGYITRAADMGELDQIVLNSDDPRYIDSAVCKIPRESYSAFRNNYNATDIYQRPKMAAFDENNVFLGFLEHYNLDFPSLGYEGFDPVTGKGNVDLTDGYLSSGKAENIVSLYWIDVPVIGGVNSSSKDLAELFYGWSYRYVSIMDENSKSLINGNISSIEESRIVFTSAYMSEKSFIYAGYITARAYGWSQVSLENTISAGDEIFFPESNINTGHYTVKEVILTPDYFQIVFKDGEQLRDEVISESVPVTVEHWSSNLDNIALMKPGDAVEISGCSIDENNTTFVISEIKGDTLYADADIFTEGISASDVTVSRKIPDLDFICEKDNRLYGVNNSEKTIYVSALGDPTNMYTYEGLSTDSFAVAVGGEGDFTGCCKYGEAVLFFKEDMLYKLVGSSPLDFALYSYNVDGLERGSEKSCVVINEVLYYKGRQGVYAYTGGVPVLISECFGERRFSEGVGGTDGRYYYLSVLDEEKKPYLFTYDTRTQLWIIEEKVRSVDFARTKDGLHYAGEDGYVYAVGSGQPSGEWLARWAPIYEIIDGKRCYSRILVRVSLPRGSYIIVKIRCDGREWREAGKIVGKTEAVVPIRIPINRCDKFELELSGRGECTILDIMREFYVGSEV